MKTDEIDISEIKNLILSIRGNSVLLDSNLAKLYGVSTKALNQAVKRNISRFPDDFMYQITKREKKYLVTNCDHLDYLKYSYALPFVFTEQGVSMLSSVLRSKKAIEVNIKIMRAFVNMRRYLINNSDLFKRITLTEQKLLEQDSKISRIFDIIDKNELIPEKGIFFDGQIFDAYKFISDLIRSAKKSIILLDNYIDESVLNLFTKRKKNVKVTIFTKNLTKQLKIDLDKYNSQYVSIEIKEFDKTHDRFMIIDNKNVYHIGASLKDLGKKWFAFSKFNYLAAELFEKLKK